MTRFSVFISEAAGSAWSFPIALSIILIWSLFGPIADYSDTWQLIINTGTTIITFLMGFLIQNTQNRDARAVHIKLDEIVRAIKEANNEVIDAENMSDEELCALADRYTSMIESRKQK